MKRSVRTAEVAVCVWAWPEHSSRYKRAPNGFATGCARSA